MKQCPMCAEQINIEAIKCKHCGSMVAGEKLDQINEEKMKKTFEILHYYSKPAYSAIAGILLFIGSVGGCVKVIDESVSLYDRFGFTALLPLAAAGVQLYFNFTENRLKAMIAGIVGCIIAVYFGFDLISAIRDKDLNEVTTTSWAAWVFGIGALLLLNPVLEWKHDVEQRREERKKKIQSSDSIDSL